MSCVTTSSPLADAAAGLFQSARSRTGQRVRRDSQHEGGREQRLWRQHNRFADSEHNARMRAAEEFETATRKPGRRIGQLGHVALEVYRFLLRTRSRKTGRLDWSYRQIADALRRSRSAVGEAIARLKAAGFLGWVRRTRPIDDPEPDGQHTEQIPNAWTLDLRDRAAELVGRLLRRPTQAQSRAADDRARHARAAATPPEQLVDEVRDPALRAVLCGVLDRITGANPPDGHSDTL